MWPLLKRDGLAVQYVAMTLLWNKLIGYNPFRLQHKSLVEYISAVSCHILSHGSKLMSFLHRPFALLV